MKRVLAWITFLAMLLTAGVCAAEGTAPEELTLDSYGYINTANDIITNGDYLLSGGRDPAQVLEEMKAKADELDVPIAFRYTCENIAAKANEDYQRIERLLVSSEYRELDLGDTNRYSPDSDWSFSAYQETECSPEMAALLKDEGAEFCFRPAFWVEDDFQSVFGVPFDQFRPARSRPGYVCLVVRNGAESYPGKAWNNEEYVYDFTRNLNSVAYTAAYLLDNQAPVFTGNPHLASEFWVFDLRYIFHPYQTGNGYAKGYDLETSMKVIDAATRETIAEWTGDRKLDTSSTEEAEIAFPNYPTEQYGTAAMGRMTRSLKKALKLERLALAEGRIFRDGNGREMAEHLLMKLYTETEDPWQRAICLSGCVESSMSEERHALTLYMRGYDMKLEELLANEEYAEGSPGSFLYSAIKNANEYNLTLELVVEDGEITEKSMGKLRTAIEQAAEKARENFTSPEITERIRKAYCPAPFSGEVTSAEQLLNPEDSFYHADLPYGTDVQYMAILLYQARVANISMENGPDEIILELEGFPPQDIAQEAVRKVIDELSRMTGEERSAGPGTEERFMQALAELAFAQKGQSGTGLTLILDANSIMNGSNLWPGEYESFVNSYRFSDNLNNLYNKVYELP